MTEPIRLALASAPGKIILLGEHAVVYGRPALAAEIDRRVEVTVGSAAHCVPDQVLRRACSLLGIPPLALSVASTSTLPMGVGLGSSAAFSVAVLRALGRLIGAALDDATVCAAAYELERLFHGFPSGVDNTVATYGGLLRFQLGAALVRVPTVTPLPFVIALSHRPRTTRRTVVMLRHHWETDPAPHEAIFDAVASLVERGDDALRRGDLPELGAAMNANHELLRRLAVSTDELDAMVAVARARGAIGAKLTGGGGGGAVICLCPGHRERLIDAFIGAGWQAFSAGIAAPQWEKYGTHIDDFERITARS